jgi:hypothetical protein
MRLAVFPDYISHAGKHVWQDFIESAKKDGVEIVENQLSADAALIWSVLWHGRMRDNKQVYSFYRSQNKPVIIIEVGALKRNVTWKICVNETTSQGLYWPRETWDPDRKIKMLEGFNTVPRGDKILICGQNPNSHNWPKHLKVEDWIVDCVKKIRTVSDRQIHVRPHPRFNVALPGDLGIQTQKAKYTVRDDTDFSQVLTDYWAVVNYNSYPGIQARLHSVNTVVNATSLASPVSHTDILNIETALEAPSDEWLDMMAHTEFYESEVKDGTAWRVIKQLLHV